MVTRLHGDQARCVGTEMVSLGVRVWGTVVDSERRRVERKGMVEKGERWWRTKSVCVCVCVRERERDRETEYIRFQCLAVQ